MINAQAPRRSGWCSLPWLLGQLFRTSIDLVGPDGPWYCRHWEKRSVLKCQLPLAARLGSTIQGTGKSGQIMWQTSVVTVGKGPFSRSGACLGPFMGDQELMPMWKQVGVSRGARGATRDGDGGDKGSGDRAEEGATSWGQPYEAGNRCWKTHGYTP